MNKELAIQWFYDKMAAKVTYSMTYRNGPTSYDCSSSVYFALIRAGVFPSSIWIGNTDSLFGDLERRGFTKTSSPKRGDIFIWGKRGGSGGAFGHTGIFVNNSDIIHCAAGYNGIHVDNHAWLRGINGNPEVTFYTYTGDYEGDDDQNVDVGSYIKFTKTYRADDVQNIGGIWQVRTHELCRDDFSWDDNGIPAEPLVEVDSDGYATSDQNLEVGSLYKIPGKFQVLDLGPHKGRWLAMIEYKGLKWWVDIETATEIKRSDTGTPTPGKRPATTPTPPENKPEPTPEPEVKPPVTEEKPQPEPEPEPEKPVEGGETQEPQPEEPNEKPTPEEGKVAFTQENQNELAIATEKVLDANTEFKPVIGDKVKTIAYFTTDISAIVSGFVLTILAIIGSVDPIVAITVNAAVTTALLGLKQTFRLSAKKD